jgi:hypothetical protein
VLPSATNNPFRLLAATLATLMVMSLLLARPAQAKVSVAAVCPSSGLNPSDSNSTYSSQWSSVSETFKSSYRGKLILAYADVSGIGDYTLEIHKVDKSTGAPSSTVLASATASTTYNAPQQIYGDFSKSPARVRAHRNYAFVVTLSNANNGVQYYSGNPCSGVSYFGSTEHPELDVAFEVYVQH